MPTNIVTSTEALAGILAVNCIALVSSSVHIERAVDRVSIDTLAYSHLLVELPAAKLGTTPTGWRVDAMLRAAYKLLSPSHRALVDGDLVRFPQRVWEMMRGDVVSLGDGPRARDPRSTSGHDEHGNNINDDRRTK